METTPATTPALTPIERVIDWEAIERDYRAGLMSTREIAAIHSVSHTLINRRAKLESWVRDLNAKIQAKADALVSRRMVSTSVSKSSLATERQVIEASAIVIADVKMSMQNRVGRLGNLAESLLAELEAQSVSPEWLQEFGDVMRRPDDKGQDKLNDLYMRIVSTPGRVETTKKLAETLKLFVSMTREAYGIDKEPPQAQENPLAALLASMRRSTLPIVHDVGEDDGL